MKKVWAAGKWVEITKDMDFFVGKFGSGLDVFGEHAKWVGESKLHNIFQTVSGAIVKTKKDALNTVGKAFKGRYWIAIGKREFGKNIYEDPVRYWNNKTWKFEYK